MYYPKINLHQLYSLNVCNDIDIIFESLEMLVSLEELIKTKKFDNIVIVPNILTINTTDCVITLIGYKINDTTYIVNKEGNGDTIKIKYTCSKENIITGIEYLYHIHKNLISAN
jgi:hypothetical protein